MRKSARTSALTIRVGWLHTRRVGNARGAADPVAARRLIPWSIVGLAGALVCGCRCESLEPPEDRPVVATGLASVSASASGAQRPANLTTALPARARMLQPGSGQSDLDGDGALDCWRLTYDGGSGFGWWTMTVSSPCGARDHAVRVGGSLGELVSVASLPPALVARPRLLQGLLTLWFGTGSRRELAGIDASLSWLIARDHRLRARASDSWSPVASYEVRWTPGTPELPPFQVVPLLSPSDQELGAALGTWLTRDEGPPPSGPSLLVYFSHNHEQLSHRVSNDRLSVYTTYHAIAVVDRGRHAWCWSYVSTGQQRLRVPSIHRVATNGHLVAAEVGAHGGGRSLVVLAPHAGRWIERMLGSPDSTPDGGGVDWDLSEHDLRVGETAVAVAELDGLLRADD